MVNKSNSKAVLAKLAGVAGDHWRNSLEEWFAAADVVAEAKALCGHGEWRAWLEAAGIPETTSRRMLQIKAAGFEMRHLAHLGGVGPALSWMATAQRILRADEFWERCRGHDDPDAISEILLAEKITVREFFDLATLLRWKLDPAGDDVKSLVAFFEEYASGDVPASDYIH